MLTSDDLKNIGVEVGKVIEQNILPVLGGVQQDVATLKTDVAYLKSQMVTKSYLDDKLAELEGSVIVRQRKEDHKVNLLVELLRRKSILQDDDVRQLQEIQVFPAPAQPQVEK